MNFDDLDVEAEVVAVTVSSLTASRSAKGVLLRWRTGTEAETVGFHVYRSRGASWTRVDHRLIPAKGSLSGVRYSFLDAKAPRGALSYRLQAVGTNGSRRWFGPVRAVRR